MYFISALKSVRLKHGRGASKALYILSQSLSNNKPFSTVEWLQGYHNYNTSITFIEDVTEGIDLM